MTLSQPLHTLGLPEHIRACLFDMDGVLTATATLHEAAWKQTFDHFLRARPGPADGAVRPFTTGDYEDYVDGKPRADGVRAFLGSRGIELPEGKPDDSPATASVAGLAAAKELAFEALLHDRGARAFEGSVRYLTAVRAAGLPCAVVTSSKHCRDVLDNVGLSGYFAASIDGTDIEKFQLAGKPAPDSYLAAARALRVEPAHGAVFEDARSGVRAGVAGGFGWVVGVDRLGQGDELARSGADDVVRDLGELLGR